MEGKSRHGYSYDDLKRHTKPTLQEQMIGFLAPINTDLEAGGKLLGGR